MWILLAASSFKTDGLADKNRKRVSAQSQLLDFHLVPPMNHKLAHSFTNNSATWITLEHSLDCGLTACTLTWCCASFVLADIRYAQHIIPFLLSLFCIPVSVVSVSNLYFLSAQKVTSKLNIFRLFISAVAFWSSELLYFRNHDWFNRISLPAIWCFLGTARWELQCWF